MNDPLLRLEQLARTARADTPPRVSVGGAVLLRLEAAGSAVDVPLACCAGAAFATALAAAMLLSPIIDGLLDPMNALFDVMPVLGV
jgi:ABC-type nitrate/sulfonate/bicarbonate transport system permease component